FDLAFYVERNAGKLPVVGDDGELVLEVAQRRVAAQADEQAVLHLAAAAALFVELGLEVGGRGAHIHDFPSAPPGVEHVERSFQGRAVAHLAEIDAAGIEHHVGANEAGHAQLHLCGEGLVERDGDRHVPLSFEVHRVEYDDDLRRLARANGPGGGDRLETFAARARVANV